MLLDFHLSAIAIESSMMILFILAKLTYLLHIKYILQKYFLLLYLFSAMLYEAPKIEVNLLLFYKT